MEKQEKTTESKEPEKAQEKAQTIVMKARTDTAPAQSLRGVPMARCAAKVTESVLRLMQLYGIQDIRCRKLVSAENAMVFGDIKTFSGVPQQIVIAANLIKDDLARILASTGTVHVEIEADSDGVIALLNGYKEVIEQAKADTINLNGVVGPKGVQSEKPGKPAGPVCARAPEKATKCVEAKKDAKGGDDESSPAPDDSSHP